MVLNVRPSPSARGALKYFKEALQIGDYLGGSAIEAPIWRGKTADILGLTNKVVSERDFAALILGADPRALQSDFQRRLNDFRYGRSDALQLGPDERLIQRVRKNRVPGIEFTFSVPKGVSLQWAAGDERIRTALQKAIDDTMAHVQQHAQTRVRRDGKNENRTTQNLLWASFTHETSRPVEHDDGTVTIDPHLHCHAYVPNVTYDEAEKRFKSTKYRGLKCRADYFQEYFESLLAREIQQLGYEVGRRGISWDVTHISPELCETFSQRTAEVEKRAAELGITSDKVKGELAAQTRIAKGAAEGIEWRDDFKARLPQHELQRLRAMTLQTMERGAQPALPAKERADIAEQAIEWALSRQLERRSTTYDHKVKADAMRWATGLCLPQDIDAAFRAHQLVIGREDDLMQRAVTKDSLVIEERTLIKFVRDTKNKHKPLVEQPRISRALYEAFDKDPVLEREGVQAENIQLPEQLAAILHVLSSTDQVMSIRGQAGTGKSYLLQALHDELQRNDIKPVALAPTAAASRGSLREAGLTEANTVAKFLGPSETGQQLRNDAKDGVIVLDEAGLASTPQMLRLLKFADKLNARVVLVGDTRQMTAVERGDALRLLEEKAGLVPAELKHIRRQKDPVYRQVVEQLADGKAEKGLEEADKAGFVHEVETDDGPQFVADWVVEQRKQGSVIVMCPVHAEGRKASDAIRRTLQKEGLVQPDQVTMPVLRQANLVEADLSDAPHTLQAGDQAIMRRDDRKRGLAAGETLIAVADERGQVHLHRQMEEDGVEKMERIEEGLHPQAFAVYRQATIPVAVGDTLRAREAIEDAAMQRGDFATVKRIDEARRTIEFEDGRSVSMDSQKLDHGYYTTPNSGQGLSARAVCFYAPSHALPALSEQGLYVGGSRGTHALAIVTDSKEMLVDHAAHSLARPHAIEVAKQAFAEQKAKERKQAEAVERSREVRELANGMEDRGKWAEQSARAAIERAFQEMKKPQPAHVVRPKGRGRDR